MRRKGSSERIYIDVNVLYYYLTAHEDYGERSKALIEAYSPMLVTSSLTIWLLHVLTKLENLDEILADLGIEVVPLTSRIFRIARELKEPRDYEDRLHLATMREHGIRRILSNDRDFDGLDVERIF